MKFYRDLNLASIMEAEDLDFARWTYSKGQCCCCYGPFEMPAQFWKGHKKPGKRFLTPENNSWQWVRDGKVIKESEILFILFKNAANGSGTVTEDDLIKDYTCINYHLKDADQVKRVCQLLQDQLDEDYTVIEPPDTHTTITIRLTSNVGWEA